MHYSAAVLFLAVGCHALPAARSQSCPAPPASAKALYVMTNDVKSNAIISMSVAENGTLHGGKSTKTGGIGGNYVSATGNALFPDSLSVQDSVVAAGGYLFAVNAGSDTVSMFSISHSDPSDIKLIGSPQKSKGEFPTAVAVSTADKMVCVANSGARSGVACASYSSHGLKAFDYLRQVDVGETTTPPVGPVPGFGDLFFTPDSSTLVAVVKGNGGNFSTFVSQFAVCDGMVATTATKTTPPGTAVLFGTAFLPGSNSKVLTADAGFGSVVLDLDDLSAGPLATTKVTGQKASCWAEVSSFTNTGFITDAAVNRLVEVDTTTGDVVTEYSPPNPNPGMTDLRTVGTNVWALSAGNGTTPASVTAFDISGGRGSAVQLQSFAIPGAGTNTMGLAVV